MVDILGHVRMQDNTVILVPGITNLRLFNPIILAAISPQQMELADRLCRGTPI